MGTVQDQEELFALKAIRASLRRLQHDLGQDGVPAQCVVFVHDEDDTCTKSVIEGLLSLDASPNSKPLLSPEGEATLRMQARRSDHGIFASYVLRSPLNIASVNMCDIVCVITRHPPDNLVVFNNVARMISRPSLDPDHRPSLIVIQINTPPSARSRDPTAIFLDHGRHNNNALKERFREENVHWVQLSSNDNSMFHRVNGELCPASDLFKQDLRMLRELIVRELDDWPV